jgi:preprotein translocase subunit SecG
LTARAPDATFQGFEAKATQRSYTTVFAFLLVLLILDGLLMMVIVLLQSGKGDGLAAMGGAPMGTDSFIGGRQAATLLTKATWVTAGLFMGLAFVLSILSSRQARPTSVLRGEFQQTAPTPQPVLPGATPIKPGAQAPAATPTGGGQAAPAKQPKK